jgi:hypothetical protein
MPATLCRPVAFRDSLSANSTSFSNQRPAPRNSPKDQSMQWQRGDFRVIPSESLKRRCGGRSRWAACLPQPSREQALSRPLARLGIERLDQRTPDWPRHHLFHLSQKRCPLRRLAKHSNTAVASVSCFIPQFCVTITLTIIIQPVAALCRGSLGEGFTIGL